MNLQPGPDQPYVPSAKFTPPDAVRLERLVGGTVRLYLGDKQWDAVKVRLLFPLTQTERMVALLSDEDEHLASVRDFEELDPESREVVRAELGEQYFRPAIVRILSLRKRYGLVEMNAVTEAGPHLIRFRSPRDDIREVNPGHFVLTDAAGNRYEILCFETLDPTSQRFWHNLV